jgi:DNA-binding CsgD family transcriptional regulator
MSETSDATIDGWREDAARLHQRGGVSERRAEAAALRERGLSYTEIGEVLGINRAGAARHIRRYRAERDQAEWLAEHGPEL